jgi:hypothetical protein
MVTSFCASILGLMFVFLSINIIKIRKKEAIAIGDGNNFSLIRAIRAHANFIEYTPFFLILLQFTEYHAVRDYHNLFGLFPTIIGFIFVFGRISHAFSLLNHEEYDNQNHLIGNPLWRIIGMMCTFGTLIILSLYLLYNFCCMIL